MTRSTAALALGLALVLFPACAATGAASPSRAETLRRIGQSAVDDDGLVGLSIAVSLDGRTIFAEGFGHADLERTKPASARTVYDIASVGKQFTSAAVMRLVDEGKLALDDRLYDLVPQTPPHFPNATIEQLLHHTSGFVAGDLDELDPPEGLDLPRQGLEVLDDVELKEGRIVFQPSETFVYCNSGYLMLGLVVEAAAGRPYAEFITRELLEPAGLTEITVCQRPDSPLMADSLHRSEQGLARVPFIHMSTYAGQGSVCASVADLLAWELALEEGRILSRESFQLFRTPARVQGSFASAELPYGMAQRLGTLAGTPKVGHTGTFDGGSACLAHYPEAGLTVAVLTNTRGHGTPHARSIEARVAAAVLAVDPFGELLLPTPLSPEQRQQIEGHYSNGAAFEARVEGEDTLVVIREGEEIARVVHTGGLVFRNPKLPTARERFLLDGETAGWWTYAVDGFLMEVNRRVEPDAALPDTPR